MYLEEIINDLQLESDKVECKSRLNRDDVVGWLKSIAGFANASGGEFFGSLEDAVATFEKGLKEFNPNKTEEIEKLA